MIEFVTRENVAEYEQFVMRHPQGSFLQSGLWGRQKPDWHWRAMLRRNENGRITGSLAVLCRRTPVLPCSMVYGCRGPVCDPGDTETLEELLEEVCRLARRERAYLVRLDPAIAEGDCGAVFEEYGFRVRKRRRRYQPAQQRRIWQVPLGGVRPDWVLSMLSAEHQQKVRVAVQRGVEVRQGGRTLAPAFAALMQQASLRENRVTRPVEYFAGLMENFGRRARIFLAEYEGRTVAGALVVQYGGKSVCVFEADDGDVTLRARYLLRTAILKQAMENGSEICEFPGVPRNRESAEYLFAEGFGGRAVNYVGELDLVLRPVTNFLADAAGTLMSRIRRWLYFIRVR